MVDPSKENIQQEVNALVRLLEDPDQEIYDQIEERLLFFGDQAIEYLETAWETSFEASVQQKIEQIIHKIQFERVKMELSIWSISGGVDLLEGVLIVNRYQYPDLKKDKILVELAAIKQEAWIHLGYEMSPLEKVNVLNHVFYQVKGFSGNTAHHQDPQNSYFNLVLETKKGNQLSLALVYSLVAQSLGIPIMGVNLPQHFILAYLNHETPSPSLSENERENSSPSHPESEHETPSPSHPESEHETSSPSHPESVHEFSSPSHPESEKEVLFYINAFNRGFIFNKKDIDSFLKKLKQPQKNEFYFPCSHRSIVMRLIHNLVSSYQKLGYEEKVEELKELLTTLD